MRTTTGSNLPTLVAPAAILQDSRRRRHGRGADGDHIRRRPDADGADDAYVLYRARDHLDADAAKICEAVVRAMQQDEERVGT